MATPLVNYGSTDGDPPLVIAGEYTATGPTAASTINFPTTGKVIDVKVYDTSAGNTFTAYVFQPAGTDVHGNQKFTIIDSSGTLTTTKPGGGGVDTFTLATPWNVAPGDLIGFYGTGPSYTSNTPNDAAYGEGDANNYTANPPTLGSTYSFGVFENSTAVDYQYIPNYDPRIYAFGVDFVPAPEPSSLVALCGFGAVGLLWAARRRRKSAAVTLA